MNKRSNDIINIATVLAFQLIPSHLSCTFTSVQTARTKSPDSICVEIALGQRIHPCQRGYQHKTSLSLISIYLRLSRQ